MSRQQDEITEIFNALDEERQQELAEAAARLLGEQRDEQ